jgi:predicted O-methyltransferase YrrM
VACGAPGDLTVQSTTCVPFSEILDDLYGGIVKKTLAGHDREITPIQSIPRSAAQFVYDTVRTVRPTTAIEVGMAWGFSSVAICSALRDNGQGTNIVVDPLQISLWEGVALAALDGFGLKEHARFEERRSDQFLPAFWQHEKTRIQFAFIDGDHRVDAVFMDFYYVNKLLDEGGVIIFDDRQFSSVASVERYALRTFHFESLPCREARFAVLRKVKEDDRGWDAYGQL